MGPLQLIYLHDLAALVEPEVDFDALQQRDEQLMRAILSHDRTLREVFEMVDILPLRFGTRFVSRTALMEHLETNQAAYLEKLDQLKGRAEYSLKLVPRSLPESEISDEIKGKNYFLEKKRRLQQHVEYQQQQRMELEELQEVITQSYPCLISEPQDAVERLYLLGDRHEKALLQEQVQQWQNKYSLWELVLGEALPPYHFVS